ncbi:MAG TPA: patatin-like phospholipase family protein [Acidimicrobiales bacterium]|nr:patatin-like phospholipase family protein [Acidimicrobiales bacterium]
MPTLRIGLTISGAASLGAYEGGALAALLLAAQTAPEALVIDTIAGASAGAITGLLAARCLVRGADPVAAMATAWIDTPDLSVLLSHRGLAAPLSNAPLTKAAQRLFGDGPDALADGPHRQAAPVSLSVAIVCLGGLGYKIVGAGGTGSDRAIEATTYLDWYDHVFDGASTRADWLHGADAALASGANAVGFPPVLFRRTPEEIVACEAAGLENVPTSAGTWYTDGGTIDNEPFGKLLDLISDRDPGSDFRRILLSVQPTPTTTPGPSLWTNPDAQPRWARTALRAFRLTSDQEIFEDLRALVKTNTRLAWVDLLVDRLSSGLASALAGVEHGLEIEATLIEVLTGVIGELDLAHREINEKLQRVPPEREPAQTDTFADALRDAVHRATGLAGKMPAVVEVVSPALDPQHRPANELLAGEPLGHFFGFVDVTFRQSDFVLGWRHMRVWLDDALPRYGLEAAVPAVDDALDGAYDALAFKDVQKGTASVRGLPFAEKLRLAELGLRFSHVAEHDVRHWDDQIPLA